MDGYEALKKITVDDIVYVHYEATKHGYVNRTGVKDYQPLWNLVQYLKTMADQRLRLTYIVAVAMKTIANGQPFWDGNHRTAFLFGDNILKLFGYTFNSPNEENEKLRQNLMAMDYEEVERWIYQWMIRKY